MIKYLITHNDLDGVGCTLSFINVFKNLQHKPTGYNYMEKMVENIRKMDDDVALMLTDMNLRTENTESFLKLRNVKSLLYIDHHLTNDIKEILRIQKQYKDKVNMIITDRASAAKLCWHYCMNHGQPVEHLEKISNIIDAYDTWKIHGPLFYKYSRPMNDLFWYYGYDRFIATFKGGFTEFNKEQRELIDAIDKDRDEFLEESMKTYGQSLDQLLFISNPENKHGNDYTLKFPQYDYYMILKRAWEDKVSFMFRVNVDNHVKYTDIVDSVKYEWKEWIEIGGHVKSGGITIQTRNLDKFMEMFLPIIKTKLDDVPPF